MEFASGALCTAIGANCRGSARIPWGGLGLYGTQGSLEVTEVHNASGYPLAFDVRGSRSYQQRMEVDAQPYLTGEHLTIEEPHVYVDIMELADAIQEDRPPRSTGEQARHVVEIIEKAHIAAASGQTQTLTSTF